MSMKLNRTKPIRVDVEFSDLVEKMAKDSRMSIPQATYYIAKQLKRKKKQEVININLF